MKSLTFFSITHLKLFWILHPIWGESEAIETYLKTDNVQVQCSLYNVTFSINSPFSYPSELFASLSSSQTNIRVYGGRFQNSREYPIHPDGRAGAGLRGGAMVVTLDVPGAWYFYSGMV